MKQTLFLNRGIHDMLILLREYDLSWSNNIQTQETDTMEQLRFGYDDNLGLPSDFATTLNCQILPYHELGDMITAFQQNHIQAMFIPAGTLPYLNDYDIISQSLFGPTHTLTLRSNFVTTKQFDMANISEYELGRVNEFCTTSFWAPQIYLKQHLPKGTVLNFENTNSFQDMLHKTAQRELDAAMVWDIILQQNPQDAQLVKEYFYLDTLPTPVIVAKGGLPTTYIEKLNQFRTQDTKAFFSGFVTPKLDIIHPFVTAMQAVQGYFKIQIKSMVISA